MAGATTSTNRAAMKNDYMQERAVAQKVYGTGRKRRLPRMAPLPKLQPKRIRRPKGI